MKFGVLQLLLGVGAIALVCVLLLYADVDGWSGAVTGIIVYALLLLTGVGWACGQGRARVCSAGFFLGCFSYLALIGYVVETRNQVGPRLPAQRGLDALHPFFQQREVADPRYEQLLARGMSAQDLALNRITPRKKVPERSDFRWTGQMIIALTIGFFSSCFAARRGRGRAGVET